MKKSSLLSASVFLSMLFTLFVPVAKADSVLDEILDLLLNRKEKDQCTLVNGERSYRMCLFKAKDPTVNHKLLYVFHGMNGDERDWYKDSNLKKIKERLAKLNDQNWTVVTISFGKFWMLAHEQEEKGKSGLYEYFLENIVQSIEEKIPAFEERVGLGVSMGGLNLLHVGLKNPDLFSKMVAVCPAVAPIGPFSTLPELAEYAYVNKADFKKVSQAMTAGKNFYSDQDQWLEDSPYYFIDKMENINQKLYLSVGNKDQYGLYNPLINFQSRLLAKGVDLTWKPMKGGHCVFNHQEIVDYLKN